MIEFKKDGIVLDGDFISLSVIIENCNIAKVKDENLALLKISWPAKRGFESITESIILPIEKIKIIKDFIIGKEISFGEIAGKHSDVYGTVEKEDIEVFYDNNMIVDFLNNHPDGHVYNYSFLHNLYNHFQDGDYEDENHSEIIDILIDI